MMKNSLIKATLTVSFLSVITRVLSFLFRIYLSRTIGAENLGIYQIALSVFFLFATLTSGLSLTLSRKTAELYAVGREKEQKSFVSSALIIGLSISAFIIAIFYAFSGSFSFLFSDERCLPLFLVLLPSTLSTTAYGIIRGWFWGRKNFSLFALTEFFECVIRIGLGLVFISGICMGIKGAYGTALSFTLSDYICTGILLILFFMHGGRFGRPSGYKSTIKTALPLTAVRVYNSLINSLIAIIVPAMLVKSGLSTSHAMSEYGRAMGMAMPLLLSPLTLTGSISTVLLPELATLNAQNNVIQLKRKIESSLMLSIFCACIFMALFIPLGENIGLLFYNDEKSGFYISMTAIIMLPMSINNVSSTILDSCGLELKTMKNYVIGSLFCLVSMIALPLFIGTYAIAVGLGLSYLITGFLNCKTLKKSIGFSFRNLFNKTLVECVTVGVCAYGATFIKNLLFAFPNIVQITIPAIFVCVFFILINSLYGYVNVAHFYKKSRN